MKRVDGLDQLGVGQRLTGDPLIDVTVEQHQDAGIGYSACLGFEAKVEAGGHTAHVADLQIEHHEIGFELGNRRPDVDAGSDPTDHHVFVGKRREDIFGERISVGGEQHVRHDPKRTWVWPRP
jgi:hypothetical protein